ncbi:MAG: hypothetical protein QOD96_5225 [Pseudonocardiales bacterium]|nr:hypothetical protein [Pseudonocardiales bacterium]
MVSTPAPARCGLARAQQWPAQVRLRGLSADAAYVASVIDQTPGPVLAVGHSNGGAVITNACTRTDNVVGLVYVAASQPAAVTDVILKALKALS